MKILRRGVSHVSHIYLLMGLSIFNICLNLFLLALSYYFSHFYFYIAIVFLFTSFQGLFLRLYANILNKFYRYSLFILMTQCVNLTLGMELGLYALFLDKPENRSMELSLTFWVPIFLMLLLSTAYFLYWYGVKDELVEDSFDKNFNTAQTNYLTYFGFTILAPSLLVGNIRQIFSFVAGLLFAGIFPALIVATFYSMLRYKKELRGTGKFPLVEPFDFSTLLQPTVRLILAGVLFIAFAALTNQLDRNPILLFLTRLLGIAILCDLGFMGLRKLYRNYIKKEK
ncbi:hypothetical protein [Streptococcus suis]|uniref:hypothetical protein n=1 Tax=Streptococcus suis TaxID=1307 RepID=UPI00040A50ED|nr:hypothetical protein [Streptococcus suis]